MAILSYLVTSLTSYLALTVSLFGLSLKFPRAGFFARCLAAYGCLIVCASYGVVASIVLRLFGYGGLSQWTVACSFKWAMRLCTGSRFEVVSGTEHLSTRPAVFISNHQTELDVLLLGAIFPPYCSVTAKKSLSRVPVLGWFMTLSGTVFIDRANRETALKAFDGAADQMRREKQSVFIFPEGTRSYSADPVLLPFKKGAFHLAIKAGVDIVPIVAENYAHLLDAKKLRFEAGTIRVKVLPPLSTKNLQSSDVDELTKKARESMLVVLQDMYKTRDTGNMDKSSSRSPVAMASHASSTAIEI
ncbi:1-acylglycerol-3-phosphate acyltransferase [Histoplasma ohiense]|nr:1-acylglycerol-3-phosphate acyltransferase [Histoplasma ohiense (nom. inval.)]